VKKPRGRAVVPSQAALAAIEAKVVARVAAKLKHFHQTELLTAIAGVNTRLDKQEINTMAIFERLEAGDARFKELAAAKDEQDKAILGLTRAVNHIPVEVATMMDRHTKDVKGYIGNQFQILNGQQQAVSDGLLLVREILDKLEGVTFAKSPRLEPT
jgi:hypothetical protein